MLQQKKTEYSKKIIATPEYFVGKKEGTENEEENF